VFLKKRKEKKRKETQIPFHPKMKRWIEAKGFLKNTLVTYFPHHTTAYHIGTFIPPFINFLSYSFYIFASLFLLSCCFN